MKSKLIIWRRTLSVEQFLDQQSLASLRGGTRSHGSQTDNDDKNPIGDNEDLGDSGTTTNKTKKNNN